LSVKQLIFLTFYLKTNKVKNQIYETYKAAEEAMEEIIKNTHGE